MDDVAVVVAAISFCSSAQTKIIFQYKHAVCVCVCVQHLCYMENVLNTQESERKMKNVRKLRVTREAGERERA